MENKPETDLLQTTLSGIQNIIFWAEGGFKSVYKATVGNLTEAIKVIFIPPGDDNELREEIIDRAQRELYALSKCKSEYLVKLGSLVPNLYQIAEKDYIIYSEEFLEGENLWTKMRNHYKPSFAELRQLTICLLDVILELKKHNLIHRDIKPNNAIALEDKKRPFVILDLGIAFKLQGTPLTVNPERRPGTLPYMAPEMFNPGFRNIIDFRSDLYSAGVTLYEYATGKHPLIQTGEDDYGSISRIIRDTPEPSSLLRPDLPKNFCSIIDQLIKKLPALRPSNIERLIRILEGLS